MKLEHVFASTNRQPNSVYWIKEQPFFVTCATRSLILHEIDHTHHHKIVAVRNVHLHDINRIAGDGDFIATADVSGCIVIWQVNVQTAQLENIATLNVHQDPINSITMLECSTSLIISSTAGDGKLVVTRVEKLTLEWKSIVKSYLPLFPLCVASSRIKAIDGVLIVLATSDYMLRFFILNSSNLPDDPLEEKCILKVGDDWITNLEFSKCEFDEIVDLAVANNDKKIRVFRVFKEDEKDLSDRLQVERKIITGSDYQIKSETILRRHENWITSSCWFVDSDGEKLVTCSMDKSVILWHESDNVWDDCHRLGEVGGGNMGFLGVVTGVDKFGVRALLTHSYTGSLHLWWYIDGQWKSSSSPSGHYSSVRDLAWSPDGSFLLSTSFDQTTRLYAMCNKDKEGEWAEVARPQVHGHPIRCLDVISNSMFASGAEEKVIRVFRATKNFRDNFAAITGTEPSGDHDTTIPEGAAVPALGLSNKAVFEKKGSVKAEREMHPQESYMCEQFTALNLGSAPLEEDLIQNTLWWEERKLYGHGAELQAIATSPDSKWIASSCKASKLNQAAVFLWEGNVEGKPGAVAKLEGHQLTVIQLRFSPNSKRLISVGRDRIAILWQLTETGWQLEQKFGKEMKGHSRLLWNCCWSQINDNIFFTIGRDKQLIIWKCDQNEWTKLGSKMYPNAITAIDSAAINHESETILIGLECGQLRRLIFSNETVEDVETLDAHLSHGSTVNQIRFKNKDMVATCADDNQVKLFSICTS